MATLLITGANRGIGLEMTRQALGNGDRVHACCRRPDDAQALRALEGDLHVHALEVTDPAQIAALAQTIDEPIDYLVHNAGIMKDRETGFGSVPVEGMVESFRVNSIAPLKLTEALVDHVARSDRKVVAVVTSLMGSLTDNTSGGYYAYRSSKAAVNMVVRCLAIDLRPRGVAAILLHPGWVRTDMGGQMAPLSVEESAGGLLRVLAGTTLEESGRFFKFDGAAMPW